MSFVQSALVTGVSRGLGRATAIRLQELGYQVVGIVRAMKGAASSVLPGVQIVECDLSSREALETLANSSLLHKVDVLINNAGVYLDRTIPTQRSSFSDLPFAQCYETLQVNLCAAMRLAQAVLPGMQERGYGRIVNVSSGMGRFFELDRKSPFYRISKTALNSFSRILADEVAEYENIYVTAVCPGWVRTEMGGGSAVRSVDEGVNSIIAALKTNTPKLKGCLLRDGENFGW